jgi:probable rRNA maturation factor
MNELTLRNRHPHRRVDLRVLRRVVVAALAETPIRPAGGGVPRHLLGIYLVAANAMAALNETHLGHAGSTDVITFDYGTPETALPGEDWLRGDLFICLDDAQRQGREFGVPWQAELVRYMVHGLLHLHGFDDHTTAARRAMKRVEERVLRRLVARFVLSRLGSPGRLSP